MEVRPTADEPEETHDSGSAEGGHPEHARVLALALAAKNRDRDAAAAWLEMAKALDARGSRAEALHAYKRATELAPNDIAAWLGRGDLLAAFHCNDGALASYERAIAVEGKNPEAWLGKWKALIRLGRGEEAEVAVVQMVRISHGKRPLRRPARRPVRSPAAVVAGRFGPVARELWISRRRLLVPAVAYVAGLVVWSLNAARNDLGPQVAANLQYLVAGVIPALVVLAALALLFFVLPAPAWTRHWLASRKPRLRRVLAQVVNVTVAATLILIVIASPTHLDDVVAPELLVIGFAASWILALFVNEEGWLFNLMWKAWGVLGVVFLLTFAFEFYAEAVYPRLPQALGGGAPRCAQLDIQTSALSSETVASLAPGASGSTAETVRTAKVDILFARDDVLFVRRRGTVEKAATHELRGDAVRAVVGCTKRD
jgi:tetratricopeptide (TPR) repeat protein